MRIRDIQRTGMVLVSGILLAFAAGCSHEIHADPSPENPTLITNAGVTLHLRKPGRFEMPSTRALTVEQEGTVNDLYVFLFDTGNILVDVRQAEKVLSDGTYTVSLPASEPGTSYKLVLLANAQEILTGEIGLNLSNISAMPETDRRYDAILSTIVDTIEGPLYLNGGDIPMWGETIFLEIRPGMQNQTVDLLRAVARIDVGIGQFRQNPDGTYGWNGLDENSAEIPFLMTEVYVIKPNDRYALVPEVANRSGRRVDAPTIPDGTVQFDLDYSMNNFRFPVTNRRFTSQEIYVPESNVRLGTSASPGDANHQNRMALVIGGIYDANDDGQYTEAPSYYRLDFGNEQVLDDVLRNNLYSFSIQGVVGAGFADVETAYASQAMNMVVNVLVWDINTINNVWFDDTWYFAVDRQEVLFDPLPGQTIDMHIRTNIPDFQFYRDDQLRMDAGNPDMLSWKSNDKYYEYTLSKVPDSPTGDEYLLRIHNPAPNIHASAPAPDVRLAQWTIYAKRLRIRLDVDQAWTSGYVSLIDRQGSYLLPEGTDDAPIPARMVSVSPITMTAIDDATGETATWIDLGSISSGDGYNFSDDSIRVHPFRYGDKPTYDGTANRSATITIVVSGQTVRYSIWQEAPYIDITRDQVFVQRPDETTPSTTTTILVHSNVKPDDLTLSRQGGDTRIQLANPELGLEEYDPRRPRNRRFDVLVEFSGNMEEGYQATFAVTPTPNLYGTLPVETVDVVVTPANEYFDTFWYRASFDGGATWPWSLTPYSDDVTEDLFVFPWNTTQIMFDGVSNIGHAFDPAHSILGNPGTLSDPVMGTDPDGHPAYRYTFTLNNRYYSTMSEYTLAFASTTSQPIIPDELIFRQGSQVWQRGIFADNASMSYAGYPQSAPLPLEIVDNVRWSAAVTYPDGSETSWLRIKASPKTGGKPDTMAFKSNFIYDDRSYAPVEVAGDYETNMARVLVDTTDLLVAVDPYLSAEPHGLNPSPTSRRAVITFTNLDFDNSGTPPHLGAAVSEPIAVTQWGRTLIPISNSLPNGGSIPGGGGTYRITAATNIPTWGVKIYDVTGPYAPVQIGPIFSYVPSPPTNPVLSPNNSPSMAPIFNVVVPENGAPGLRRLRFVLTADGLTPDQEQEIGTWTQLGGDGILAPPGVLGVSAESGQLTLLGSKEFAGTTYEKDSPTGAVSTETVYITLFKWGSTIALSSMGGDGSAFTPENVLWTPAGFSQTITGWGDVPRPAANFFPTRTDSIPGIGDPCTLADDGRFAGWKTASGNPWNALNAGDLTLLNGGMLNGVPVFGRQKYPSSVAFNAAGTSMYMPYTGWRDATNGTLIDQRSNPTGHYWSRTPNGTGSAYSLTFSASNVYTATSDNTSYAMAVRCVNETPVIEPPTVPLATSGILAPPGVLGVGATTGRLTLRGSREYGIAVATYNETDRVQMMNSAVPFGGLSDETVYVALFKRGSLIGTGSNQAQDNVAFNMTEGIDYDVVWVPPGFAGLDEIAVWGDVPYQPTSDFPANDPVAGLGDPCAYADNNDGNSNWRMPTAANSNVWNSDKTGSITAATTTTLTPLELTTGTVNGWWNPNDASMYLVASGYRNENGMIQPVTYYAMGYYWASDVNFTELVLQPNNPANVYSTPANQRSMAMTIRCVPK